MIRYIKDAYEAATNAIRYDTILLQCGAIWRDLIQHYAIQCDTMQCIAGHVSNKCNTWPRELATDSRTGDERGNQSKYKITGEKLFLNFIYLLVKTDERGMLYTAHCTVFVLFRRDNG